MSYFPAIISQFGQHSEEEVAHRDLLSELEQREKAHFDKVKNEQRMSGLLITGGTEYGAKKASTSNHDTSLQQQHADIGRRDEVYDDADDSSSESEEEDDDDDAGESSSDEDDDEEEAELLRELEKIKKERELDAIRKVCL